MKCVNMTILTVSLGLASFSYCTDAEASSKICVGRNNVPSGAHTYIHIPRQKTTQFVHRVHEFAAAHSFSAFDYPSKDGTRVRVVVGTQAGLALVFSNFKDRRYFLVSISDCGNSRDWIPDWHLATAFLNDIRSNGVNAREVR
jgi:hypothetical protein